MTVQSTEHAVASEISAEPMNQSSSVITSPSPRSVSCCLREAHAHFDRRFVCETLAKSHGNISRTAVALGISRIALQKKLRH
jgi:DNA-binding NtrC family response regulator